MRAHAGLSIPFQPARGNPFEPPARGGVRSTISPTTPVLRAGEDPLVLRGMEESLAARKVDVLEFEYNRRWKSVMRDPRPVGPAVERLRQLGYVCFWQGNSGALAQMSAPCYLEETRTRFGFARSNAVCSHRADIIATFRACRRADSCRA